MGRFCPAPWITISTDVDGSIRPCCRYEQPHRQTDYKMPFMKDGDIQDLYNGPEMKALREAFVLGKEPAECNWCWREEAAGVKSFRQKYLDRGYMYSENNPTPQIVDLKLSNVCNLKCRMCGPQASSSIAKEMGKSDLYWLANKIIGTDNEHTFFNEWLPNIQELELTGGEPFFSPENKQLLERIVDSGEASHINLLITTNGMFYIPKLMKKLSAFRQVKMSISLDDVGKRLEYARGDSNWKVISSNLESMKKNYPNFIVTIYRTINNYNVFYLDELDQYATANEIFIGSGLLHQPKHLCIQNLPVWAKDEVNDKLGPKYNHILDFMNKTADNCLVDFIAENKKLDTKRNQSFSQVFPEWSEILFYD